MKTEIVKIDPKEYGLEQKNVKNIEEAFAPKIEEREGLSKIYGQIIKKELVEETCVEARELRIKLVKVRTGIAEIHKTQKAFFFASGKFVDAWKNKETEPVTQMENKLREIENYFERIELQKKEKLQAERVEQLKPYLEHAAEMDLHGMEPDVWEAYLSTKKRAWQDIKNAEEKAEKERLKKEKEEKERQLHIEKENIRLKKEADEKQKKAEKEYKEREKKEKKEREERGKIEIQRLEKEEAERKERENKEQKEKEEWERKERISREKREKLEAQIQAKKDEEEKRIQAENDRVQSELKKGDSEKVKDLISDLEVLKTKYSFKSDKNIKIYSDVGLLIDKVINHISLN